MRRANTKLTKVKEEVTKRLVFVNVVFSFATFVFALLIPL